jgi:bifunctional DNase/RNase
MADEPRDPEDFDQPPPFFPQEYREQEADQSANLVRVVVLGTFGEEVGGYMNRFVQLTDGERFLRIVIGAFEAMAITQKLEKYQPDRPLTHDLIRTLIERLGGDVRAIKIDDLYNETYYAKIVIKQGREEFEIDARPSDAIAIAVRFDAPILVSEEVLKKAAE